jgi:MFS superfamily sulfate permease-like transporter
MVPIPLGLMVILGPLALAVAILLLIEVAVIRPSEPKRRGRSVVVANRPRNRHETLVGQGLGRRANRHPS